MNFLSLVTSPGFAGFLLLGAAITLVSVAASRILPPVGRRISMTTSRLYDAQIERARRFDAKGHPAWLMKRPRGAR